MEYVSEVQPLLKGRKFKREPALGLWACLRLYLQGRRDGRRGVPPLTPAGVTPSPFMEREHKAAQSYRAAQELLCAQYTAQAHIRIQGLLGQRAVLSEAHARVEDAEAKAREGFAHINLTQRKAGESRLDPTVTQGRRRAEFERSLSALHSEAASARRRIDEIDIEVAGIEAIIHEAQHITALRCNRFELRSARRVAAYLQAAATTTAAASSTAATVTSSTASSTANNRGEVLHGNETVV